MQLAILASTSASLAGTRSRLEKVRLLADCLRQMSSVEYHIAVSYLMGTLPQGKIGLGHATLRAAVAEPAPVATLSLADADAAFQDMSELTGSGSQARRKQLLAGLLRRATAAEQVFLRQLLLGELRQGALEGVMAKSLAACYQAGSRGADWFKIKPTHTLDLVVLAAEWGSGRRRGRLSNLHLGARDPDTNSFVMLGKTFKGLTDATLEWQTQQLLAREIGREGHTVHVRPELVVEVAFNELQRSRQYPAGMALRFARVKRYRQDKSALEADTIATVTALYKAPRQDPES